MQFYKKKDATNPTLQEKKHSEKFDGLDLIKSPIFGDESMVCGMDSYAIATSASVRLLPGEVSAR